MFFSAEWSLGKVNQIPCICICFYLYLYSFSVCISLFRFWKSEQVALARRDLSGVLRCPAWGFPLQTDTHILLSLYPGACQGIRSSRNKVGYIWQGVVWIRRKGANGQNINYKAHNGQNLTCPAWGFPLQTEHTHTSHLAFSRLWRFLWGNGWEEDLTRIFGP